MTVRFLIGLTLGVLAYATVLLVFERVDERRWRRRWEQTQRRMERDGE